ncbi:lipoprotein [bacterium]|nr:lipoprotein [bacterium]
MKKILFALLFLLLVSGCSQGSSGPTMTTIVYEVSGTTSEISGITISNSDGGTSQYTDITTLPWTYTFSVSSDEYTFLYVSAQNGTESGSVTVKIYKNDSVYKESTSSGAYVIATASGSHGSL